MHRKNAEYRTGKVYGTRNPNSAGNNSTLPTLPSLVLTAIPWHLIIVICMPTSIRAELPYLRTAEVADILGISKRTLKNWLRDEFIAEPQRNPSNRYRLWTLEDVEAIRRVLKERNGAR